MAPHRCFVVVFTVCTLAPFLVRALAPQWDWQCQTPGVGGLCALVCASGCVEGPLGYPGGCGFCKFCSPDVVMESPDCVTKQEEARDFLTDSRLVQGEPGWIDDSSILVHDVNSWFENSQGVQMLPAVMTGVQCARACKGVEKCNGWSFCWSPDGCGQPGECSSIPAANNLTDSCSNTMGIYPRCAETDGRFGPMTCVLHSIDLGNSSQVVNTSDFYQGWTSGVLHNDTELDMDQFNFTCFQ